MVEMELLEMKGINKSFFGNPVLNQVSLSIGRSEVHALLGENGAGKSTLMNILAGVYKKSGGTILFDGKELSGNSVKESEAAGIAFVHQELNIINDLKVFENVFLGKELVTPYRKLKKKEMIEESRRLFQRLGVDINPETEAGRLDTSKKQMLEIGKALHTNAKLIILDEPTTALNNSEVEKFFEMINRLKKEEGKSFIFISHKMPEIFAIADKYTVLRNGSMISTGRICDTTPQAVAKDMVGESLSEENTYHERKLGEVVLEVKNLQGKGFSNISLAVRQGEIIGFTGLQGSGCSQVLQGIFGSGEIGSGSIYVHGSELRKYTIQEAMEHGIAMVAANRKENSVIPDMTILENIYLSEHCISRSKQHIHRKKEIEKYEYYREKLNIKSSGHASLITSLSGGNQQKVIIGRWLNTEADILLLDNPTQGIDIGAKDEIYKLIIELSREGKTIIVNTLEIPEIQKIADRCIVFYHGNIAAELSRNEIREETVMLHATNAGFREGGSAEGNRDEE